MLAVLADAVWVVQVVEALTVLLDVEELLKWAQHFQVSSMRASGSNVGVVAVYRTIPDAICRTRL